MRNEELVSFVSPSPAFAENFQVHTIEETSFSFMPFEAIKPWFFPGKTNSIKRASRQGDEKRWFANCQKRNSFLIHLPAGHRENMRISGLRAKPALVSFVSPSPAF